MSTTSPTSSSRSSSRMRAAPDEPRHVQVVPAGVHQPGALRRVVDVDLLGDRQRVHVAAQQHDRPLALDRCAPPQHRDDRAQRLARGHLEVEPRQRLEHRGLRVGQVQPELRDAVQPAAQVDELRGDAAGHGEGVGHGGPLGGGAVWHVDGSDAAGPAGARHPHEGMPGCRVDGTPPDPRASAARRPDELQPPRGAGRRAAHAPARRRARRRRSGTSAGAAGPARWRCPGTPRIAASPARPVLARAHRRASRRWGIDASIATSAGESHPASA